MALLRNLLWTGGVAALMSAATAGACSRRENRRAAPPINAVSHVAWGGRPPYDAGPGAVNFVVGAALHAGASVFWAAIYEGVFGRWSRRSKGNALAAGAAMSAVAYVTDYKLVSRRFRPGYEAHLSRRSLFAVYVALAAGLAVGARLAQRADRAEASSTSSRRPKAEAALPRADVSAPPRAP